MNQYDAIHNVYNINSTSTETLCHPLCAMCELSKYDRPTHAIKFAFYQEAKKEVVKTHISKGGRQILVCTNIVKVYIKV